MTSLAVTGRRLDADIDRLLAERPDAVGLTVTGMGTGDTPYDVLMVRKDGSTEVFASYPNRAD